MNKGVFALVIVGVLALLAIIAVILFPIIVKNGLISKDEAVDEAWAQIDAQLQRRMDLIPNLVSTVKGYAKHEKEVFESISNARSRLLSANTPNQKAAANGMLDSSLGRLLAIAEKYPDLKADKSFIRLQDELAGTENRITVARSRYNRAVKEYNASIRKFPGSMFAKDLELEKREYFKIPESKKVQAQAPPEVKF